MERGLRFWTPILDLKMLENDPKILNRPPNRPKIIQKIKKTHFWASWGSSGAFWDPPMPRGSLRSQFWTLEALREPILDLQKSSGDQFYTSRSPPGVNFDAPEPIFEPPGSILKLHAFACLHPHVYLNSFACLHSYTYVRKQNPSKITELPPLQFPSPRVRRSREAFS